MDTSTELQQLLAANFSALDRADTDTELRCYTEDVTHHSPAGAFEGIDSLAAFSRSRAVAANRGRRSIHVVTNLHILRDDGNEVDYEFLISNYQLSPDEPTKARVVLARMTDRARRVESRLLVSRRQAEVLLVLDGAAASIAATR